MLVFPPFERSLYLTLHSPYTFENPGHASVLQRWTTNEVILYLLLVSGLFIGVCRFCVAVLCCRMSPLQKAQVAYCSL